MSSSLFFQNKQIIFHLYKLDNLDRISNAWIGFNYSVTQTQKTF